MLESCIGQYLQRWFKVSILFMTKLDFNLENRICKVRLREGGMLYAHGLLHFYFVWSSLGSWNCSTLQHIMYLFFLSFFFSCKLFRLNWIICWIVYSRIKKLIDIEALGLSRLSVIVLDVHPDVKGYSLLTLPQVRLDYLWTLPGFIFALSWFCCYYFFIYFLASEVYSQIKTLPLLANL